MPRSAPHVGVVGCGRWGALIVRDLVALGCTVTVVARTTDSQQRAAQHGAHAVVASPRELPAIAGAVVATPTATHAEIVTALLAREIPVYCEKPLTADPAAARHLARLGRGRLFVMDKWRYHEGIVRLGEIARSGELGPVIGLRSTRVQPGNVHHDVDAVWILAPHDLSIGLEVLGYLPEPVTARAERVGDRFLGLIGVLGGSPWLVLEVSAQHPSYRREVRLTCRDGAAVLAGGYEEVLHIYRRPGGVAEQRPIAAELPLRRELKAFLDHLDGGPPPKSSADEGARIVEAIARLRELADAAAG